VQEKSRFNAEKGIYSWEDHSSINVWCTPEKNLKFAAKSFVGPRETSVREEYYFHGHGRKVAPIPSKTRRIRENTWLIGCTGTKFLTSLHLLSWWGLPEHTEVKQHDDILLLRVKELHKNSRWWKDNWVRPTYGCHPTLLPGGYEVPLSSSEIEIDKHSLRPLRIKEMDKNGQVLATIEFNSEWLPLDEKHFPKEIKCYLPKIKSTITYKFNLIDHVWLINETYLSHETDHLSKRSCLKTFDISPIQDITFDATIPRKSETTLMQGERIVEFETYDGLTLEGKLSVPLKGSSKFPVVFFLPGAGPWTFDRPIEYPVMSDPKEMFPENKKYNYCDFYAKEFTKRGIAFYRVNKRGCAVSEIKPYERVSRQIFSKATLSILLKDYEYALNELRNQPDIDKKKIVLLCGSEGTILGPRLALISPDGILSVVMFGYVEDNARDVITWQNTVGPWRNISRMFDANSDKKITKDEYDTVIKKIPTPLNLSFSMLDRNQDGTVQPRDLENKATLKNILNAAQKNDDDYLWDNLLNLTSSYLREDWNRGPNHKTLLKLEIPLGIFHGKKDGTCRVEGVIETKKAFEEANKQNLTIKIYQKTGHDLNWASFLKDGQIPNPFQDIFNYIKNILDNKYN
jgi:pimeloyl-ACP methyl ester carboxylesterase